MKNLLLGVFYWMVIVALGLIFAEILDIPQQDGIIVLALAHLVINQNNLD